MNGAGVFKVGGNQKSESKQLKCSNLMLLYCKATSTRCMGLFFETFLSTLGFT